MEHKGTKVIETDRLTLRPFCIDDVNPAYKNWTSDEKVAEFLRWPAHTSIEITESVIKGWVKIVLGANGGTTELQVKRFQQ